MNNINVTIEDSCAGCGACAAICPKQCISMLENERGFFTPIVETAKCINCGMCRKACPELNSTDVRSVKKTYAAVIKDGKMLKRSTSGGMFGCMASLILKNGGIVYGCSWKSDFSAQHIKVDKIEDLYKIQQSKYVQSEVHQCFPDVKASLDDGKCVMFSGTACQIAGLYHYLNKEYSNLITVEVACHGVPSVGLFKKYISWIESKNNEKLISFQFRTKTKHKKGEHYMFCYTLSNGRVKYHYSNEDPYYGSFLEGRTLRDTCYHCKYKGEARIADILLCDFWGIEKEHPKFPAKYGTSAIVLYSEKGIKLFERICPIIIFEESDFNRIASHNKSLVQSAICDKKQRLQDINIDSDILFEELKPSVSIISRVKNILPESIKYFLKRI